jgi:3-methyladenine DNA glycosylase AlkD
MKNLVENLRSQLNGSISPEKRAGMEAYMKNHFQFMGITSPARKEVLKTFSLESAELRGFTSAEWKALFYLLWEQPEREFQYCALDLFPRALKTFSSDELPFFTHLISTKSWWDTVDMLAGSHLGTFLKTHPSIFESTISEYAASENMWINRSAIICQLKYGKNTQTDWLEFSILPHLHSKEFFHQKAIGWALRQYAKHDSAWVFDFVNKYPLKPLSRREALKHFPKNADL